MLKKILLILLLISSNLFAGLKIDLEVSAKGKRKIPIALKFASGNPEYSKVIQEIIKGDLLFSEAVNFNTQKAEFLVEGETYLKDGKINLKITVKDLVLGKVNLAKIYSGSINLLTRISHRASNEIIKTLTGESQIFEAKILYVSDKTGKKQIYLMDYDGRNRKRLVYDNFIATYPEILGDFLFYTSFRFGRARVVVKNLKTGKVDIAIRDGIFSAGADISSDGKKIAAVIGKESHTDIGIFDVHGRLLKVIGSKEFSETSPRWANNSKSLLFVSDRTGSPQVYLYNFDSKKITRISFGSNYSCYPCWGAEGEYIYYASLKGSSFKIMRTSLNYFHIEEITEGEYPDVSNDNKYLLFTRRVSGYYQIFIMNLSSGKIYQITDDPSNKYCPKWYYGKY